MRSYAQHRSPRHGALAALLVVALASGAAACSSDPEDGAGSTSSTGSSTTSSTSTSATTTAPPKTGPAPATRIAFTRQNDPQSGQPELWTGNIDGSDLQPVGDQHGFFPAWSPDRTHLVFDFYDEDGNDQIGTIRPDGSGFRQLTDSLYNEAPDYSPDGSTIVFARAEVGEDDPAFATALWGMEADGSNPRRLAAADNGDDTEPEYSPDGSSIVFVRNDPAADTSAIHIVDADGTDVRQLTPYDMKVEHPRWSPDGRTIIYNIELQADLDDARNGIWTVPATGGDPALLLATDEALHPFKPDYSADGARILFGCLAREGGSDELCVMDADGTGIEQLTDTRTFENHPVWS